jgi:hypothetical protein
MGMRGTKTTILNLFVETFFAVLPLIVLGAVWPDPNERHPESFWSGPELSMTSCILYGLTLARWLQGAVFAANRRRAASDKDTHEVAASYAALFLLPLLGVILSVILIGQSVQSSGTWKGTAIHIMNLVAAIMVFFVLGGHGIKLAEEGGERDDSSE